MEITEQDRAWLGIERGGGVLRLRLKRPERRNSLSRGVIELLIDAIENAVDGGETRVIVLSAEGDHFCSGIDLISINRKGGDAPRPRAGDIQRRLPRQAHRLIPAMLQVQIPIVCAVRGWAAGIGCQLALAADFAFAAEDARFWQPFVPRGFTPDSGATWLLPRLIGVARAREMLLLGREVSGAQAAEWGMIHRAVDAAELDAAVDELVSELAGAATVALGLTKWTLQRSLELDLEHALANEGYAMELSSRSRDFKEGLAAFKDKRPPRYEGS